MFPLLLQIQDHSDSKEVIPLIVAHLETLTDSLDQYFPSLSSEIHDWVGSPLVGSHKIHEVCKTKSNLLSYSDIVL
jgi:hypothetical protein